MQRRAKQQNNARNLNCIALLNHNSAAVAFSQIRDQADRRQKLKWLHYRDTLRPRYVCTKSNLASWTNLMLSTNPLVFSTKSNLHQMAPTTPSQTAFFTFFLCIFNLSRAILGAVWINLILPQNGGPCIQIIDSTQTPCDQVLKLNALYRGKSDKLEVDPSKVCNWMQNLKSDFLKHTRQPLLYKSKLWVWGSIATQRQGFVVSLELDLPVSILVGTTFNMYANDKMCGWSVVLPWFNNWPPIVWSPYWRRLFCIKPQQGRTMVLGCKDWVARLFSSETIRLFRLVQPWLTMDFGQAGSRAGSDRLNWNLNSTSATM